MITFFYGVFSSFFVGVIGVFAGNGLSRYYVGRQLLSGARPNGESRARQAQRQMRIGMSMILTALALLVLFSIVGIISHKLAVVVGVLVGLTITTPLYAVLFTVTLRDHFEK